MSPSLYEYTLAANGTSSATPTYGDGSTTAGHLLVAWAWSNDSNSGSFPISISDDTWTLAAHSANADNWVGLWYKADCAFNETLPTFTDTGFTVYAGLAEFASVATSSPLDQTGVASASAPCTANGADSAGGDLIVGISCWNGANANPGLGQATYGSDGNEIGTTNVIVTDSGATSGAPCYIFTYAIGPATLGSDANVVSPSSTEFENYVSTVMASFKAA